jgi:hypothetical protein
MHVAKSTGAKVAGSPINVTNVEPRFREYHLVELNKTKADHLKKLFSANPAVRAHQGDCNDVLPREIFRTFVTSNIAAPSVCWTRMVFIWIGTSWR